MSHTPRPWTNAGPYVMGPDGRCVSMPAGGHFVKGPRSAEELLANTRLIAAAPDLLDALGMLMDAAMKLAPYPPDVAEGMTAIVDIARLALIKATVAP